MKRKNIPIRAVLLSTSLLLYLIFVIALSVFACVFFARSTSEKSNELINATAKQITYNYENYLNSILNTASVIQSELNEEKTSEELSSSFDSLMELKSELLAVELYDTEKNLLCKDTRSAEVYPTASDQWFTSASEDQTIHFFEPMINDDANVYNIIFSKALTNGKFHKKVILKMVIDFKEIIELNYKTDLGESGHITVIDDQYNVVYSSTEDAAQDLRFLKNVILGQDHVHTRGHAFTLNLDTIGNSAWRIAIFYNTDDVKQAIESFLIVVIIFSAGMLAAGVCAALFITRKITVPIKKLETTMAKIEREMTPVTIKDGVAIKEVTNLSLAYNKMICQIRDLMDQVVTEQKNQRKSELKALQHQINPHFLYNTLDSIVYMINDDRKQDAQKMIIALAKLFRISISRGNNIIPVQDEIEHVRNYLLIQSMRYKNSFSYEITAAPECLHCKIMKLILQPIVENCIYHGLKNKIDPGFIRITADIEKDNLVFKIADNGYGMKKETIKLLYERFNNPDLSDGVGLKNVYQRLSLYYGERAFLHIESEIDCGTEITLSVPVEVNGNEKN